MNGRYQQQGQAAVVPGVFDHMQASASQAMWQLSQSQRENLFSSLQRGQAIIGSAAQADCYLHAYGRMHHAKLLSAFSMMPVLRQLGSQDAVHIIDYGCGQGLATVVLLDYLAAQGIAVRVSRVTLIEPSQLCLSRAESNVGLALQRGGQAAVIDTVGKGLAQLSPTELQQGRAALCLHLFSNILDMPVFDVGGLCETLGEALYAPGYFVCVSPRFSAIGRHSSNARLDQVMEYFCRRHNAAVVSVREGSLAYGSHGKLCQQYERIFATGLCNPSIRGE